MNPHFIFNGLNSVNQFIAENEVSPRVITDKLLADALEMENGRPRDDISILVASVLPDLGDRTRRLDVHLPLI